MARGGRTGEIGKGLMGGESDSENSGPSTLIVIFGFELFDGGDRPSTQGALHGCGLTCCLCVKKRATVGRGRPAVCSEPCIFSTLRVVCTA